MVFNYTGDMTDKQQPSGDSRSVEFLFFCDLNDRSQKFRNLQSSEIIFVDVASIVVSLSKYKPEIVLSLLIDGKFDALEIAHNLSKAGYDGKYRIMCETLNYPEGVLAEIKAVAPAMDIEFVLLDELSNLMKS